LDKKNKASTKQIIAFPHMGHYDIPVKFLMKKIVSCEIMSSPKISAKTIELGTKYSPDFVCTPFKYTIGTLIESLEKGATILIQAGGGCRYGYYSELQEQILKDLGYDFTFINLVSCGKTDLKKIYKKIKNIDEKFNPIKAMYYLFITSKMIKYMDIIDDYIRQNIGFEVEKNSFIKLQRQMYKDFSKVKTYIGLRLCYKRYKKKFESLKINKPDNCLKIGLIGELYTLMEPYANYYLETELASYGMEIKRYTNVHYLVFEKKKELKKLIKYAYEYVKYKMGADATDNIARTKYLCENGYDGIIHIKSSFCTPEIGAMPVLNKICGDYNMPIIFFSFDSNTSEVGIKTRIEAFYDMIEMKKKNSNVSKTSSRHMAHETRNR
jgi:predicted nucleotide-binding protein (sugar kinase/HSP70/actin superfamily)